MKHDETTNKDSGNEMIINILLIEHVFSYLAGIFRNWEIARYGKTDMNGIMRAPKETLLSTLQIFVDCILFGWSIYHLKMMSDQNVLHH